MAWLSSIFDGESMAANLIVITVSLVVVLLLLFWLFRKIAGSNKIRGSRNRRPRLAVTDAAVVDDKRRLVLVRRDNVEHLVLIGGASDVLIEQNIVRVQSTASITNNSGITSQQAEPDLIEQDDTPKPVGISAGRLAAAVATAPVATANIGKEPDGGKAPAGESAKEVAASATASVSTATISTPESKPEATPVVQSTEETPIAAKSEPAPESDSSEEIPDLEADLSSEFGEMLSAETLETTADTPEAKSLDFSPAEITTPEQAAPEITTQTPAPETSPATEQKKPAGDDMEDEMQKLLRELSGEKVS